jgi:hypothetical protein
MGNSIFELNGQQYSLDDPTAAERMPEKNRELFWSFCSDQGKDSDLYRSYANSQLSAANIDLSGITNPAWKLLIINHASSVAKLGKYLTQHGNSDWLSEINKFSNDLFDKIIRKSDDVQKILEAISKSGYESPFNILKSIEPDYLNRMMENAYETAEFLSGLKKMGYADPLSLILGIDLAKLKYLLENRYEAIEFTKGLLQVGYTSPLNTLLHITQYCLVHLLKNRYEAIEWLKALNNLGYQNSLETLLNINQDKLTQLFNNRYESIELMKFFRNTRYSNPLQTLLDLDNTTLLLFYQNRYEAIEIMKALYSTGKSDPVAYLISLGRDAMITMFSSRSEYENRIKRGVDLMREFQPEDRANNEYRPELKKFIQELKAKESNRNVLASVSVDSDNLDDFRDSYTTSVVNIPVRLDGDLFDLDTLVDLKQDREGYRKHPVSGDKFLLSSLQSAKDVQKNFDKMITRAKDSAHENKSSGLRP